MHTIKHNGTTYLQNIRGNLLDKYEMLEELGGVKNEMIPGIIERINTADPSSTCKWCSTAYRLSETKQGHCPFCFHLV